ncbi:hypothetical protein IMSAGC008_02203 [Muribaculaceae bacterium]|jgi:hypothetical protein|nr:hypothetical protein IMSAGC008_02203 [Muribaculaceae bacterium]
MSHTSTTISRPVAVSDVMAVLGTAETRISALCRHPAINRFARCKPYNFGGILRDGITESTRRAGNFGMAPALLGIGYIEQTCLTPPWGQWTPPEGTYPSRPCRLGDFDGYNRLAEKYITGFELRSSAGPQYTLPIYRNPQYPHAEAGLTARIFTDNTADLRLSDFAVNGVSLGDMYLTIGVADVDLTRVHVAQAPVPVGDDSVDGLNVKIVTTKIDDLAAFSPGNKVFAGLFPRKLDIDEQYRCADFGSADLSTLYSLDMWGDGFRQVAYNEQAPVKFGTGGAGGTAPEKETVVVRATASRKQFDIAEYSYSEYGSSLSLRPQVNLGSDYIAWDPSSSDKLSMLFGAGWYLKFNARLELFENGMTAYDGTIDVLPRDYGGTSGASFDLVQWAYGNPVYFEFNEPVRFDGVYIGSGVRYTGRLTLTLDAYCSTKIPLIRDASTGEDIRLVCEFEIS